MTKRIALYVLSGVLLFGFTGMTLAQEPMPAPTPAPEPSAPPPSMAPAPAPASPAPEKKDEKKKGEGKKRGQKKRSKKKPQWAACPFVRAGRPRAQAGAFHAIPD